MDGIEVGELCDSDNSRRLNPNDQTWQIRSSNPNHTYSKVYKNKNVTSAWISEHYKEKFIDDLDYSLKSLQQDVKRDLCCIVSLTYCKRAKLRALKLIEEAHKAQYEKIYEYLLDVRTQNKGTTTIYCLDNRLFQRMYVYLQTYKDGNRAGCRRIIALNRCFLKGYYGGYLLAAVRIDANNGIYHLAYAVVESENQASWLWFLELLAIGLEIVSSYQISFIFDKQKQFANPLCCLLVDDTGSKRETYLTMMETVRTKIMLLIVKKKEANKWKETLCPKIRKKLDVNIKNLLR
ncbi:hypothetical protein J1N35_009740 [Gossypium stocksii]|uniref:MULE transposase domain-containing protein n=1 Tax=Gossypium stocksii TaxID=47602 RepID=A0A9D4A9V6_9ROSI|nr:hypothetical protein J1N35_009740 [Gossypium stocksii]